MEGRLGGLFKDGKQVGGFLDWNLELLFADTADEGSKVYKFAKWKLTSPSYWLFDKPDSVVVRLYQRNTYWEGDGIILSKTQGVFDAMIHEPIELIGEGSLEERR